MTHSRINTVIDMHSIQYTEIVCVPNGEAPQGKPSTEPRELETVIHVFSRLKIKTDVKAIMI